MKPFCILLSLTVLLSACQISSDVSKEYEESPCNDTQYMILKKMNPSELTSGQAEYMKLKEKECEKFTAEHSKKNTDKKQADSNLIWILTGVGLIIAAGILISLSFKNGHW